MAHFRRPTDPASSDRLCNLGRDLYDTRSVHEWRRTYKRLSIWGIDSRAKITQAKLKNTHLKHHASPQKRPLNGLVLQPALRETENRHKNKNSLQLYYSRNNDSLTEYHNTASEGAARLSVPHRSAIVSIFDSTFTLELHAGL